MTQLLETITWTKCSDDLPRSEMIVLARSLHPDYPVWLCYHEPGRGWCAAGGARLGYDVTWWASVPSGPAADGTLHGAGTP